MKEGGVFINALNIEGILFTPHHAESPVCKDGDECYYKDAERNAPRPRL